MEIIELRLNNDGNIWEVFKILEKYDADYISIKIGETITRLKVICKKRHKSRIEKSVCRVYQR